MMTLDERIKTYLAQNGSTERLTFRQERRLRKVANRRAKAARKAVLSAQKTYGDYGPVPHPDDIVNGKAVPCPTCGVFEGPCKTKSGNDAKANHKGRE